MNIKKLFSGIGWGYVLFVVLMYAFQYLFVLPLALAGMNPGVPVLMLISEFAMYGCAFPLFYLWMRRLPKWKMRDKKKLPPGQFFLWILFSFGAGYLTNIIGQLLIYAVSTITGMTMDNPVNQMLETLGPGSLLLYVVIIAPLMEELIFRKLLIDRIIPYGQKTAIIISGVAFGLFHGNFFQFFYACVLGMIFAYLYTETGTMWYGVIIHAIINFTSGFLTTMIPAEANPVNPVVAAWLLFYGTVMIFSMVVAITLFCIYARKVKFYPGWAEDSGTGFWRKMLFAPGVIGYLIMCVIMFL